MITSKSRIQQLFEKKSDSDKIMSLFITAGYPDLDSTPDLITGFEKSGADLIELGMPFSDPLADGPTIQYSSNIAIENGTNLNSVLDIVRKVREKSEIPLVLMGYVNPVLHYGPEKFFSDAARAGADGLILPDVPVEEAGMMEEFAEKYGLRLIYLIAPNTSDERMRLIDEKSNGFVYCVSVAGVTGAREGDEVHKSVEKFINRVNRNITKNPVLIGFGIKNHEDAMKAASQCDGFIVGSALIDRIRKHYPKPGWDQEIFSFVSELKNGKS